MHKNLLCEDNTQDYYDYDFHFCLFTHIQYISSNVLNAMGLRQHPLLNHLRQLLERSITNTTIGDVSSSINTAVGDTGKNS